MNFSLTHCLRHDQIRKHQRGVMALVWLLALVVGSPLLHAQSERDSKPRPRRSSTNTTVIERTGEVSLTQPRVFVQLKRGQRILEGEGVVLEGFEEIELHEAGATSFAAFLDTGAGAYVISRTTAQRFGIITDPDSVYMDVGLHGDTAMTVSEPYTLSLSGTDGTMDDVPTTFELVDRKARMEMNPARPGISRLIMGSIDVVGMPAIQRFVVEIDLTGMLPKTSKKRRNQPTDPSDLDQLFDLIESASANLQIAPAVRLHSQRTRMKDIDLQIPLTFMDFNRPRNAGNRGSLPSLAPNPMLAGIECKHQGESSVGDWLLDTGAAASMISSEQAIRLGIYDVDGTPLFEPAFTLPLSGISGQTEVVNGYVIDHLFVVAARGKTLEFRNVSVAVKDIGIMLDDGTYHILDGIFGMNLLFPSASGLAGGMPTDVGGGPFKTIWIDGPRQQLGLKLND